MSETPALKLIWISLILGLALFAGNGVAWAAETEKAPVTLGVEELKAQVIELNRELAALEDELLFPASSRYVVFLSATPDSALQIDSVRLKLGDKILATQLYTDREVRGLQQGGMQRLHIGNLAAGVHEVTAIVEGIDGDRQTYTRMATLMLEKDSDASALEVRVRDQASEPGPAVDIIEWR